LVAKRAPVSKDGFVVAPHTISVLCFENTSKEAAQAESIFDNNRVLQEEPTIFMA